jgi:HAMP domain-containing protein
LSLRLRLILAVLGATAPLLLSLVWLGAVARSRAEEEALLGRVQVLFSEEQRALCEADPARWSERNSMRRPPPGRRGPERHRGPLHGPLPGPPGAGRGPPGGPGGSPPAQLYPLDGALGSRVEGAPTLAKELREAAERGRAVAVRRSQDGDEELLELLVRTPWGPGPCAHVLAQHHGPRPATVVGSVLPWLLVPAALTAGVMLLALGPVIRRIRRLAVQVQAAARSGYEQRVTLPGSDELGELAEAFNAASREVQEQMAAQRQREVTLRDFVNLPSVNRGASQRPDGR